MLHTDNDIIVPVWFAVPGKIKRLIIVFGTNSRHMQGMNPIIKTPFMSTCNIHTSPSSRIGINSEKDEKRKWSYQSGTTFQCSSRQWQLTSLLSQLSHTDDTILTHSEIRRSFPALFISFYGSHNSQESQWPWALI